MKMRLRALSCPTGIIAVLLITAPQVGRAATEAIDPTVTGNVQLTGGSFVLEEAPFSLFAQQLPSSNIDASFFLEFSLASLTSNSVITAATLELDVNQIPPSGVDFPVVPVFGYAGDGVAEVDDSAQNTHQIGTSSPITSLGLISINLDVSYIASLVGNASHLGLLLMGDANGFQAGFDNLIDTPVLKLSVGNAGDFDQDGDVDGEDFLLWQRNPAVGDLADWETNYGTNPLVASIATVPETATFGLALLSVLGMLAKRSPARHCMAANSAFCKPNSAIVSA